MYLLLSMKSVCVSWILVGMFCLLLANLSSSDLPLLQHAGITCTVKTVQKHFFHTTLLVFKYSQNSGCRLFIVSRFPSFSIQVILLHFPKVDSI